MGRLLRVALPVLLVVLVAAGAWLVFTGTRALAAVRDLRGAVAALKDAADDADAAALQQAAQQAQDAARRADQALDDPVWATVAAIPYLGDSARTGRAVAAAMGSAADALDPLQDVTDVLDPVSVYADGRIDVQRLAAAQAPLSEAAASLQAADQQMQSAPRRDLGAWVPQALDDQRQEAADELSAAARTVTTAADSATVLPQLLGADAPRRWFVGVQSPAEARGTGGVMGTYVVLTAADGRLTLEATGSNSDLPVLEPLPDLGDEFTARYGTDPALIANTNMSPHFPYAARLWQEAYARATGQQVDVVAATDVVAFGHLIEALGPVSLPDGRQLDAQQAVDFALTGVYAEFGDNAEREQFQEAIADGVFSRLTSGDASPQAIAKAVGRMVGENRLLLWSPDEDVQQVLGQMPTSGSVTATIGPFAQPVIINSTASKLDTYLTRDFTYEVGRCAAYDRVRSRLSMTLESAIPAGVTLPEYVVAQAQVGPEGPVSNVQLQVHLNPDADVRDVTVDGAPVEWFVFREQGRRAVMIVLDLQPRDPVTVSIELDEPSSVLPASVPVQPLAQPATVSVVDVDCAGQPPGAG